MSKVYLCIACGIGHVDKGERFCVQHKMGLLPEEKEEITNKYNTDGKFREIHAAFELEEESRTKEGRMGFKGSDL